MRDRLRLLPSILARWDRRVYGSCARSAGPSVEPRPTSPGGPDTIRRVVHMSETGERVPVVERNRESTSRNPPSDHEERILLLECRLEHLRSALDEARADADRSRASLAVATAREAAHARRHGLLHQELAEAREEIVSLHERLDRSEVLRAELDGHLFESGARDDTAELVRLRREVLALRERSLSSEQTLARVRARMDQLLLTREVLLTRVAAWQRLVQTDGPEAVDLAEFMAELRQDILDLERRNAASERHEAELRERMIRAGLDPDAPSREEEDVPPSGEAPDARETRPGASRQVQAAEATTETDTAAEATAETETAAQAGEPEAESDGIDDGETLPDAEPAEPKGAPGEQSELEVEASGLEDPAESEPGAAPDEHDQDPDLFGSPSPGAEEAEEGEPVVDEATESAAIAPEGADVVDREETPSEGNAAGELQSRDPTARAAALERMARLLRDDPTRLGAQLRLGFADVDPRVRRRAVLAAATSRGLELHSLLDPLRADRDPQVRRVVREVLRHASPTNVPADDRERTFATSGQEPRDAGS